MIKTRIEKLRKLMREEGIAAYLIPTDDFHGSEYVGEFFKCRQYISGFTGSAGTVVVTLDKAGLWTDGRYFLQAEAELLGSGIDLYRQGQVGVPSVEEFLSSNLKEGETLGFDGRTVTYVTAQKLKKALKDRNIKFSYDVDLVGDIWEERPS